MKTKNKNKSKNEQSSDSDGETNNIRGKAKSGRFWKSEKTRARSLVKTRGLKNSYERLMKLKKSLAYTKSLSRDIIAKKKQEKEDLRLRQKNNQRLKEENERKAEVVQVIKNPEKIKKMRKKQLRTIEKRDTLSIKS